MKLAELMKMHHAGMMQVKDLCDGTYLVACHSKDGVSVSTDGAKQLLEAYGWTAYTCPITDCMSHTNKFLNTVKKADAPASFLDNTEVTFKQSCPCDSEKSVWRTHVIFDDRDEEYTMIEGKPGLGGRFNVLCSSDSYVKPVSFNTIGGALDYLMLVGGFTAKPEENLEEE